MSKPSVHIERVPASLRWVKVAVETPSLRMPLYPAQDARLSLATRDVCIELLPVEPLAGVVGFAGWALVGDTLRGVVREGPDADFVEHWLTCHLDLMLAYLQSGLRDLVEHHQANDRICGDALRTRIAHDMLLRALSSSGLRT